MKLQLKVIPSSSQDCIVGWLGDALKVKVRAPAEKGKANKAVIKLLETSLGLGKGAINIENGSTSSRKIIQISDDNKTTFKTRLAQLLKNHS